MQSYTEAKGWCTFYCKPGYPQGSEGPRSKSACHHVGSINRYVQGYQTVHYCTTSKVKADAHEHGVDPQSLCICRQHRQQVYVTSSNYDNIFLLFALIEMKFVNMN